MEDAVDALFFLQAGKEANDEIIDHYRQFHFIICSRVAYVGLCSGCGAALGRRTCWEG